MLRTVDKISNVISGGRAVEITWVIGMVWLALDLVTGCAGELGRARLRVGGLSMRDAMLCVGGLTLSL